MKKKKIVIVWFVLLFLFQIGIPLRASAKEEAPNVNAHAYVVMDANSGEILLAKQEKKRIYPASAAKLMTAMVVIDRLDLDRKITVKQSVLKEVPNDASSLLLKAGSVYTGRELLHMLLISSAADAANILAVETAGSTKKFAEAMNEKAAELGCTKTSFDNAIGLDIGNGYTKTYTTAAEFANITRYAMSYPQIRDITAVRTYQMPRSSDTKLLKNTNQFYSTREYSRKLYDIIGSKTGTTKAAGYVLMATARDQDGHEVICAFFGSKNIASTYEDIRKLLDYIYLGQQNGSITLTAGCYDLWYRDSRELIAEFIENGYLKGNKSGAFLPDSKVRENIFCGLLFKVSAMKEKPASGNPYLTAERMIGLLSAHMLDPGKASFEKEMIEVCYDAGVLPKRLYRNPGDTITKEEMVILLDYWMRESAFIGASMDQYLKNLPLAG